MGDWRCEALLICNEVSTVSGSDRVEILAVAILGMNCDPVATAPGTDLITENRPANVSIGRAKISG